MKPVHHVTRARFRFTNHRSLDILNDRSGRIGSSHLVRSSHSYEKSESITQTTSSLSDGVILCAYTVRIVVARFRSSQGGKKSNDSYVHYHSRIVNNLCSLAGRQYYSHSLPECVSRAALAYSKDRSLHSSFIQRAGELSSIRKDKMILCVLEVRSGAYHTKIVQQV